MTYFECYADEILLKTLNIDKKNAEHSLGRSKVCFKLSKNSNSLGLVDEDPNSAKEPYLKYLFSQHPSYLDNHIILFVDNKLSNKLILLRPNLEVFSIKIAKEKGIDLLKEYNLLDNWKILHDDLMLNKSRLKRKSFEAFLSDVSDHKAINTIKEFIKK